MRPSLPVIVGVVIFFGVIIYPIYYGLLSGKAFYRPEPKIVTDEKRCVEPVVQYMREKHPELLESWRTQVVRTGNRTYISTDGREYTISLTDTCLRCHPNVDEFCNRCHEYVGLGRLNCWECHTIP